MHRTAICGASIFDGNSIQNEMVVIVGNGRILDVIAENKMPANVETFDLSGGLLAPGFIDIQVNGGGGIMFNSEQSVATLKQMMRGHRKYGTTGMLPTLITASRDQMEAAIIAVRAAIENEVPGILGVHLEGPYLNPAKRGVHSDSIIRPMEEGAVAFLASLGEVGITLATLAPECVPPGSIADLVQRGVIVCAGHTNGTYGHACAALAEGMTGFTHLFNAMSPISHREPGMAGAAIDDADSWCGLIVDGHHVNWPVLRIALKAKAPRKMMLVTDAMATVGAQSDSFVLDGIEIFAADGRCATADGTLAGAHLDMATAVRNTVKYLEVSLEEALRMASLYPAEFLGLDAERGKLKTGYRADMVWMDDFGNVSGTWINGQFAEH